jgi:hypothetical protein
LGAIAIPTLLPPPMPMLPFLFGAGAMQYPVRKFLLALTLGRMIRYALLAFLAGRYGRPILAFIAQHGHPGLVVVVGLVATVLPYSSLSLQVKDNSIAPHNYSNGAKSFMDCDLVNFDQSFFPNNLILKIAVHEKEFLYSGRNERTLPTLSQC